MEGRVDNSPSPLMNHKKKAKKKKIVNKQKNHKTVVFKE